MASNEAGGIGVKLQSEGFGAFEKRMEAAAQSMEGTAEGAEKAANELNALGKPAKQASKDFAKAAGSVEEMGKELKALGSTSGGGALDKITKDYKTLQATVERGLEMGTLDNADRLRKEIQHLEGALDKVARTHEISVEADGVQALNKRLNHLQKEAKEAGIAVGRAGGHVRGVNNTLFAFSDLAEDSAYGIRGMANNVPFLVESFGQLSQKTGGATNAIKALLGNLLSTGGLVAALGIASSVAVTFGDDIIRAFRGGSAEADELRKSIKKAGDEIVKVRSRLSGLSAEVTPMQARAILPHLETRSAELKQIQGDLKNLQALSEETVLQGGMPRAVPLSNVERYRDAVARLRSLEGVDFGGAVTPENAEKALQALEAQGYTVEEIGNKLEAVEGQQESYEKQLRDVEANQRAINTAIESGVVSAADFVNEISQAEDPMAFAKRSYESFREELGESLAQKGLDETEEKAREVGERIGFLETTIDELRAAGVKSGAQMEEFSRELVTLRAEEERLTKKTRKATKASLSFQEQIGNLTGGLRGLSGIAADGARLDSLIEALQKGKGNASALTQEIRTLSGEIRAMQQNAKYAAEEWATLRDLSGGLEMGELALGTESISAEIKALQQEKAGADAKRLNEIERRIQMLRMEKKAVEADISLPNAAGSLGGMRDQIRGLTEQYTQATSDSERADLAERIRELKEEARTLGSALDTGFSEAEKRAQQFAQSFGSTLSDGFASAFQTLAEGLGQNLAGLFGGFSKEKEQIMGQISSVQRELNEEIAKGSEQSIDRVRSLRRELSGLKNEMSNLEPSIGNIAKDLLGVFGDTLVQLGSALSAFGAAGLLFQKNGSFASFFKNPAAALAAGGIALSAGAAIKAAVASGNRAAGASAGGGGGSSSFGGYQDRGPSSSVQSVVDGMTSAQKETQKQLAENQKQTNDRLASLESATREGKAVTEAEARNQKRRANRAERRRDPAAA